MENIKVSILTSSSVSWPLIALLAQKRQLAGVLLLGQWDQEKAMLEKQLKKSDIPTQYCSPEDLDTPLTALASWRNQLSIVFFCSEKIPAAVANAPTHGTINLHGSSLPDYRGPDPIYWQIRNGETQFNFTAHQLAEGFDTGAIVGQQPITIGPYDTASRVFSNLSQQLPAILNNVFSQLEQNGSLTGFPQQGESRHTAHRVTEKDLRIDWHQVNAEQLCNQVRAGNPQYGGARLTMGQGQAQLLQATPSTQPAYGATPGSIIHVSPEQGLIVALKKESVRLDIVANNDGVLGGYRFAQLCNLSAGMRFE